MKKKVLWGLLCAMIALSLITCDDGPKENPAQKCKCSNPCTIVNCTCPQCPGPAIVGNECKCSNPCTIANCTCPDCPGPAIVGNDCKCSNPCTITNCTCPDCPGPAEAGGQDAGITINFGDETFTLDRDISTPLSKADNDSISIEVSKSFTSISWVINSVQKDEQKNKTAITLNAADLPLGNCFVTAIVSDGISWYSRTVTFTVGL